MASTESRWLDRPQQQPLRKLLFKIHMWTGLALGLYIVVISVSGSAAVFRREVSLWLIPRTVEATAEAVLSAEELQAAITAQYPGYVIVRLSESRPERPSQVALEREGTAMSRLIDPYSGKDIGDPFPPAVQLMEWLVRLHDDLLSGDRGRKVNGVAALFVTTLILTGAVIWWPGRRRWRRSMLLRREQNGPRLTWQLHSVLGFWCFALLFVWAVSGIYLSFPQPFETLIDRFDSDPNDLYRPGEALLLGMLKLHFGRFGGLGIRVSWALLGLVPATLFVTGFMMWWRSISRRRRPRA